MEIVSAVGNLAAPTEGRRRGVVMTMGALHEGHVALVRAARAACDEVVVTIFVNPLQFNDDADLERYPRNLDADLAILEPLGVDLVFAPTVADVYPAGEPVVTVASGRLGEIFEGAARPGHFDGMLTVVLKLLNLTRPHQAFFGEKDAQQLIAVRRMVADFNVPAEIVGVPTVRAADGLALSSRNAFLPQTQRADALELHGALVAAERAYGGGTPLADVLAAAREALGNVPGIHMDYFDALDPARGEAASGGDVIFAGAVRVGTVRLIDNVRASAPGRGLENP